MKLLIPLWTGLLVVAFVSGGRLASVMGLKAWD